MLSESKEFAPAKVNLTLHVTGQRADGYHLLDSLVVFAGVGDVLKARLGHPALDVSGPFAEGVPTGAENAILRAAALLGIEGAFHLTKHLPHPAGIGGGSADAAAAIRALCRLTERDLPKAEALLPLGADMPVCLAQTPQRMTGIGGHLEIVNTLAPMWLVLVNPGVPTPTGQIFNALASKENVPMGRVPSFAGFADQVAWLQAQRNDLEAPAKALCPPIETVLTALEGSGAALARMSGSGATCFGLFADERRAELACAALVLANPSWWVRAAPML